MCFSEIATVVLIPSRQEQGEQEQDLFWTREELSGFRRQGAHEVLEAAEKFCVKPREAFRILYDAEYPMVLSNAALFAAWADFVTASQAMTQNMAFSPRSA